MFFCARGARRPLSFFALTCPDTMWNGSRAHLEPMAQVFLRCLDCFHGVMCHDREYYSQHYSEQARPEVGGTRVAMLGVDPRKALPGVYWGNLFGPPVTEWLGAERIRSCPCHEHREVSPGYHLIIAYADINAYDSPEAVAAKDAIRTHLGPERFFDRRFHNRDVLAPQLDWSELDKPLQDDPRGAAAKLEELREEARQMGGWLDVRDGKMQVHLEGGDGMAADDEAEAGET